MNTMRPTGKSLFRLIPLSLLFLSTQIFAAPEAQTARKQIYNQAVANATADIQRTAKQKGWKDFSSKLNVFIPTEVSRFQRCARPLTSALPAGDRLDLARLRYDIRCDGPNGWEIAVTVKPDVYLPILVAKNTLDRGRQLAASDVEIKKRNVVGLRDGFMTKPDEAIGFTLKKRVRELQAIAPAHLDQPVMIERGQQVVMIAEQDGVQARMMGEALKKGRKGDIIKVRNLQSQRVVSARVDDRGVVRMLVAPGTP
ncbi:flagellar basal body P-ring formation protein FlgA [Pantoea sp. BIGb0393]|uniref:Flagella basal body P-ring formation protein FlgA n=1 Tax=Pantoea nemavictus TaxID=2726955 RepID=A0ABU8PQ31_9GAMM|nr:flagellar basal body P-ring formation chaperone FlgA [Pantoea nemavictus]MBA0035853.1 flagellar basal body P-ring formation protein FlgA [Pantoea nemavictus]